MCTEPSNIHTLFLLTREVGLLGVGRFLEGGEKTKASDGGSGAFATVKKIVFLFIFQAVYHCRKRVSISGCLRSGGVLFGDNQVDAQVFDCQTVFLRNAGIGDDDVDVFRVADFCKSSFAELTGISQHDGFLRRLHHFLVECGLSHIGGRESEFKVDAVHAEV